MNGYLWKIRFVSPDAPILEDRTGRMTVATTDPSILTVNLSSDLKGDFLMTVLIHELGHCALWSFGFIDYIHSMTYPEYWVEMEEFMCNLLADYGLMIFRTAYRSLGYQAWKMIPEAFNKYSA